MKKLYIFTFLLILSTSNIFSQSGWNSIYFSNVSTILRIVKRDSLNFIALCSYSKYFFKTSNAGNNWVSLPEYSFDSNYSFFDGQFINSQTGWIVGANSQYYNGVIFKTINGGLNWAKQNTGFDNKTCYSICFLDQNTGWVGSQGPSSVGYLMKTTNGGLSWNKREFPGAISIRYSKFFDQNNGWIAGTYLVSKTTNGGQNWINITVNNIPPTFTINYDLFAINMNEIWALVGSANNGITYSNFLKSTSSGDDWNLMYRYTDSLQTNSNDFWRLNFINGNTGFANGSFSFIARTTNSGLNWSRINAVSVPFNYPIIGTILPIDGENIIAGGGYSGLGSYLPVNYVVKSSNTGTNWSIKTYNYNYKFYDIHFRDQQNGLAVTDTGLVFKTTNNGILWTKSFENNTYKINNIIFVNSNTGCAFGNNGKILRTTDYGNNWIISTTPTNKNLIVGKFINSITGFVIGNSGTVLKSTDLGNTWNFIPASISDSFDCKDIDFINENTGWIVAQRLTGVGYPFNITYYRTKIFRTTNSGFSWESLYDSTATNSNGYFYNGIRFFDIQNGWAFTSSKIMRTTNGGANWINLQSNIGFNINKLVMMNSQTGWIGGTSIVNGYGWGSMYKTTNGGLNWLLHYNEYGKIVRTLHVLDSNRLWLAGDLSSIYYSSNGGGSVIGFEPINSVIPKQFSLHQNYPNPFNPVTKIQFQIPLSRGVSGGRGVLTRIVIYDLLGREVTTLVNEQLKPGSYEVNWDGTGFASGVYFYSLITSDYVETKRMVLVK